MQPGNQPIDAIGFSTRVTNVIATLGVTRLEELACFEERDLYRLANLGKKSVLEIRDALAANGLALGKSPPTTTVEPRPPKPEADLEDVIRQCIARRIPFLESASLAGCAAADNHLGRIYLEGLGVPRDYRKARVLFIRPSRRGCRLGDFNLALIYRIGYGVRRSLAKAERLMRRYERTA
jgi:TPR repeat protein